MCAFVKPKDIPFETECLEKRILFIKNLKDCLQEKSRLVTATVELYSELLDDILHDVCLGVHRDTVTCAMSGNIGREIDHEIDSSIISTPCTRNASKRDVSGYGIPKHKGGNTLKGSQQHKRSRTEHRHQDDSHQEEKTLEQMIEQAALHFGSSTRLGIQMSGSKGAVDMFGNMIQPVALDQVDCPNCDRKISSGRFAPHLEKCMGGGRLAGRASKLTSSVSR